MKTAKKLSTQVAYDVILSRAIPDYAHFAAALVHRHMRVPWVANWNDPIKESRPKENSFCVHFLVDKPEIVAEQARKFEIEDVIRIEETVPYSKMPAFLAQSHVLVIIEAPLEEGIFMASKIVDYAQIKRPILALSPPKGTIADLISTHGGGIAVDCRSPAAVERALAELYGNWEQEDLSRVFQSEGLLMLFDKQNVLGRYLELIERLQSEKK